MERMRGARRYLLVSPCRDEADYMRRTLDSVSAQTVLPALWIVVDDGSTDETPAILEEYRAKLPYLRVVHKADRGQRAVGPGVIDAFYAGLDTVDLDQFDYLCKLDLDLDLPPRYFERLMVRMESDPRIGTTSGKPWFRRPGSSTLEPELCGDEMSVGMTKFYRVGCFREIGGFVRQVMWDGIDCHTARTLGWLAESVDDEAIRFVHLRAQGTSHVGIWRGRVRAGFGQVLHGHLTALLPRQRRFSALRVPRAHRQCGHALGLRQGRLHTGAPPRQSRVPALRAPLPARLPRPG